MLKAGYNDPAFIFFWSLSNYCPLEDSCNNTSVLKSLKTDDLKLKHTKLIASYQSVLNGM